MAAPNTLPSWKVESMLRSLDDAMTAVDNIWVALRREHAVLPLGVPTQHGVLRACLAHVRSSLLEAAITHVHVESTEAAQ
jgi:hypothetical protein